MTAAMRKILLGMDEYEVPMPAIDEAFSEELLSMLDMTLGEFLSRPITSDTSLEEFFRRASISHPYLPQFRDEVHLFVPERITEAMNVARARGAFQSVRERSSLSFNSGRSAREFFMHNTFSNVMVAYIPACRQDSIVLSSEEIRQMRAKQNGPSSKKSSNDSWGTQSLADFTSGRNWKSDGGPKSPVAFEESLRNSNINGVVFYGTDSGPSLDKDLLWCSDISLGAILFYMWRNQTRPHVSFLKDVAYEAGSIQHTGRRIPLTPAQLEARFAPFGGRDWISWLALFPDDLREHNGTFIHLVTKAMKSGYAFDDARKYEEEGVESIAELVGYLENNIPYDFVTAASASYV